MPDELRPFLDQFGPEISQGMRDTHAALLDLAVHLISQMWEISPGEQITDAELHRHGFDPQQLEPDPADFM